MKLRKASVRIGTASWTDPTMVAPGVFYPPDAKNAEDRLNYYADQFPLVEVDSTYYALPVRRMGELWLERTPPEFTFDIKAHALMTGQPSEVKRLPKEIREQLPIELQDKGRIYGRPAQGAVRRDLGPVPGRGGAAPFRRQIGRYLPAVSEVGLPVQRGARRDRGSQGTPGRCADGGRVPSRVMVQRQERRAHARLPRQAPHSVRHGGRAAGHAKLSAAD